MADDIICEWTYCETCGEPVVYDLYAEVFVEVGADYTPVDVEHECNG